MPIVLQARREDRCITYEPQDFAAYAAAIGGRGITAPSAPFRVRLPAGTNLSDAGTLEAIEPEIAAFFGLGKVTGVDYVIARQ